MNILIYSFNRCGSSNLLNFLEQEFLNLNNKRPIVNSFFEPFSDPERHARFKYWYYLNMQNKHTQQGLYVPNLIVKTISGDVGDIIRLANDSPSFINNELLWYDSNFKWDRIIILYRENVIERIESMWAQKLLVDNGLWADTKSYYLNNEMPREEFLKRYNQETNLQNQINSYNDESEDILKISYESLYYRDGLDILKKFLERDTWYDTSLMSVENKVRKTKIEDSQIVIDDKFEYTEL